MLSTKRENRAYLRVSGRERSVKVNNLRLYLILVAAMLAIAVAACGEKPSKAPAVATQTIVDDLNRTVTVPKRITRIVSLAPNLTESVFAVGAGDRLVGVTTFCNYPEQARSIAKVGDTMTPNIETIIALKPDVVLVSTASQIESFMKTFDSNRIAVYVTDPKSLEDVFAEMKHFGQMFGTEEQAEKLVDSLRVRVTAAETAVKQTEPTRVFVQISKEPLFTIGRSSFLNGILAHAGAISVTADVESAYPKLSKETALALKPDAIILSDSEDNREPNDVFNGSPAVKNGRVFKINADIISRPGPRLVDAIEQIGRSLHPDKFSAR